MRISIVLLAAAGMTVMGCKGKPGGKRVTDSGVGTNAGSTSTYGGTVSGYLVKDRRIDGGNDLTPDPWSDSTEMCATSDGGLMAVWVDDRTGVRGIWSAFSPDNGQNWNDPVQVNDNAAWADFPTLACGGGNAYVAFEDRRGSEVERSAIYFSRSTDGGATWSANELLGGDDDGLFDHIEPEAVAQGSEVHVVWSTDIAGAPDMFVSSSTDSGQSFATQRIDGGLQGEAWSGHPDLAMPTSGQVVVAWEDRRNLINDIYVAATNDSGNSWSTPVRIDTGSGNSFSPQVAANQGDVYVVWHDQEGSLPIEAYAAHSTNGGVSFDGAVQISEGPDGDSVLPQIALDGSTLHATWFQGLNGGFHIVYKQLNAGVPGTQVQLDHAPDLAQAIYPRLSMDGQRLVVAWRDDRATQTEDHDDLFYTYSEDGGQTWSQSDLRIDSHTGPSAYRTDLNVILEGTGISAAWSDERNGTSDIFFIHLELGDTGQD